MVQARPAALDAIFAAEFAAHPVGAMSVGVVERGRLVWMGSYGFADAAGQVPATPRTVYRIGSITKQFTAYALLQLVATGKVSLENPADRYAPELDAIPGFKDVGAQVTLLSLATHRAGLAREPGDLRFLGGPIDTWQATAADALAHTRLAFPPDAAVNYSNIGYAALGLALERAAGRPYTALVEDGLIRPLGMTSTSFRPDPDMLSRLAKGYSEPNGGPPQTGFADAELAGGRGYKIPNGGLFSTVEDLARFLAFEMGYGPPRVLAPGVIAANFQRSFPMGPAARYGIGFERQPFPGGPVVGHGGAVAGYAGSVYFDPSAQVGVVCLSSRDGGCRLGPIIRALFVVAPQRATAKPGPREPPAH